MEDNNFRVVYSRRYKLTEQSLNRVAEDIKKTIGVEVCDIQENENGYIYKGKYGISIGDITYVPTEGKYRRFNYHQGSKEAILSKEREEEKRRPAGTMYRRRSRQYKLQRNKRIGVALTAGAIAVLVSVGAIALKTNAVETKPMSTYSTEYVNTVANANDLILNSWANYAIGEVSNGVSNSRYENAQLVADDLKNNFFNNLALQYYNYSDQIKSGLPEDVVGKLKDSYHNEFRNQCYIFDEALESSYFSYATFDESPYADAVVFDQYGNRVVANGLYGESYDSYGNLILPNGNIGYTVYVKAVDVPGNNYSITNLPSDTKFINGETYVSDEHLDDFVNSVSKTK